ncbi:MAG TPA: dTDP-glucose 4,6-dehydratase [Polyangia bacterium]|nr:dTDP-glucose 4,6-dehydratase [Polyangia bacterium]
MNLLITGGAGFIGSCYARLARARRPAHLLVNVDSLTYAGNLENLKTLEGDRGHVFVRADIRDKDKIVQLLTQHRIEAVINFAAESHVDRSILSAEPFLDTNVTGTLRLLEAARTAGVRRFVQVSTDEVYGSLGPTGAFEETTPVAPRSPYSASKAAADHLVMAFHHTHGVDTVITRCSNNYGPYQFPEKLIPLMILNAFEGKPLPVYGDGLQVRDWIHVEDHSEAIDAALLAGRSGEVYNIGAENERPNMDVVRAILAHTGRDQSLIRHVPDRPGHDRRYAMNASKARRELDWTPRHNFDAGLAVTVAWYRNNEPWWQHVRSGAYRDYYEQQYGARLRPGDKSPGGNSPGGNSQ